MNVLETLSNELKDKNLTTSEKARYLYLRCAEIFTYDPRYRCRLCISDGKALEDELRNRKIDLENVEDFNVVCTSIESKVYSVLLEKLLGITDSNVNLKGHSNTSFNDTERDLKTDFTITSDLTRVKMKLRTIGYKATKGNYEFENTLRKIDKKIGYLKEAYYDMLFRGRSDNLYKEFLDYNYPEENSKTSDEFFIYRLYTIKEIFDEYKNFLGFIDANFCIDYLSLVFLDNDVRKFEKVELFDRTNKDNWLFKNVYKANLGIDNLYFILEQNNKDFSFYEISESEACSCKRNMKEISESLVLKK